VRPEDDSQFAPALDAWASSIANLQAAVVPAVVWPAERARRHGLSYPSEPHAALAAKIVGLLGSGPQSSSRLAICLGLEEHVVVRRLRQLRADGDVVLTLPKLWRLTAS
jgi:hypothetical protein